MSQTWVTPLTLTGRAVRLEPLYADRHAEGLWQAVSPDTFQHFASIPTEWTLEGFRKYLQNLLAVPDMCPFCQVEVATNQPVGVTTFMEIRPAHRGLEIGSTWIGKTHQGTAINPEAKYLLLRHAFENLKAIRLQLKTDSRNLQSQRAIEKIGAKREGVLRNHYIMPDGHYRHSVYFSVTDEEWPEVKTKLEARLGYAP
ncbi:MAG: GNAT family N-acetyltransferase [Chloroflexi bacterium]|nr:GNAT family N-acetyltransferase [Chloroflexota bacterium]